MRTVRVGILGNSMWSGRLAAKFGAGPVHVRQLLVGEDASLRARSIRSWLCENCLWSCDVLHVIGYPQLWRLWAAAAWRRMPVILHWIGSDVLSFLASPRWSKAAGPVLNTACLHLAGSRSLVRELRQVGVYAKYEPLGVGDLGNVDLPPLLLRPAALAYLPADRFEFYGGLKVLEMALRASEIEWFVVANDGRGVQAPPNVRFLGYVENMDEVYRQITVLVRLTEHDGTGVMPVEALARGRHVVWSQRMPFCRFADSVDVALREVRGAIATRSLNLGGADFVRREFGAEAQRNRLAHLYRTLAE